MLSIKSLYKIGPGPSSSHTMGPASAVRYCLDKYKNITNIELTLYCSLALTGKGHLTDYIADKEMKDIPHQIIFDVKTKTKHPNTMKFVITTTEGIFEETIISVGGGLIKVEGSNYDKLYDDKYELSTFNKIKDYCLNNNLTLIDFIHKYDDDDINSYLEMIYSKMVNLVDNGLTKEGLLPGKLKVERKAKKILNSIPSYETESLKERRLIMAYAFAASEENAAGEEIVTAPTCGSCGVLPSLVKYYSATYPHQKMIDGLAVAGLIGLLVKTNASISGAECGCQAEIGTASSMGAALITFLNDGSIEQIGRASEIAMEHSLGLTCDPVGGYVQIPCIERNAIYALRSIESATLAMMIEPTNNKISFDEVVKTMYKTGLDLQKAYRETAKGGLAKMYRKTHLK